MSTSTYSRRSTGAPTPHTEHVTCITGALLHEYDRGGDVNEVLFEAVSAAQGMLDQRGQRECLDDHSPGWWEALPLSELMARHRARATDGFDVP